MSKLDEMFKEMERSSKRVIASRDFKYPKYERFKFSSPRLNAATYGGIPRGVLLEFWGDQNDGKTTTSLDLIGNAQKQLRKEWMAIPKSKRPERPQAVIFIDAENTYDPEWAAKLGVNNKDLIMWVPDEETYAEKLFQQIEDAVATGEVGFIVLDSLGVLVTGAMHEKTIDEKTMGGIAASLKMFSRKIIPHLRKHNTTLLALNQVTTEFNPMTGRSRLIPTGGKGWRHNISLSLRFRKGDYYDEKYAKGKSEMTDPRGHFVRIFISKTKLFPPNRRNTEYPLDYLSGVDSEYDVLKMGEELGYIYKMGGWHTLYDPKTGEAIMHEDKQIKQNGANNFLNTLKELNLYEKLEEDVYHDVSTMDE